MGSTSIALPLPHRPVALEDPIVSPTAVPTRITIDFRDAVHPSRTWILGLGDAGPRRVELLAFDGPPSRSLGSGPVPTMPRTRPTALSAECACPDFCERDHANE